MASHRAACIHALSFSSSLNILGASRCRTHTIHAAFTPQSSGHIQRTHGISAGVVLSTLHMARTGCSTQKQFRRTNHSKNHKKRDCTTTPETKMVCLYQSECTTIAIAVSSVPLLCNLGLCPLPPFVTLNFLLSLRYCGFFWPCRLGPAFALAFNSIFVWLSVLSTFVRL